MFEQGEVASEFVMYTHGLGEKVLHHSLWTVHVGWDLFRGFISSKYDSIRTPRTLPTFPLLRKLGTCHLSLAHKLAQDYILHWHVFVIWLRCSGQNWYHNDFVTSQYCPFITMFRALQSQLSRASQSQCEMALVKNI